MRQSPVLDSKNPPDRGCHFLKALHGFPENITDYATSKELF